MRIIQFAKKRELLLSLIPKLLQRNVRTPAGQIGFSTKSAVVANFTSVRLLFVNLFWNLFKHVTLTLGPLVCTNPKVSIHRSGNSRVRTWNLLSTHLEEGSVWALRFRDMHIISFAAGDNFLEQLHIACYICTCHFTDVSYYCWYIRIVFCVDINSNCEGMFLWQLFYYAHCLRLFAV